MYGRLIVYIPTVTVDQTVQGRLPWPVVPTQTVLDRRCRQEEDVADLGVRVRPEDRTCSEQLSNERQRIEGGFVVMYQGTPQRSLAVVVRRVDHAPPKRRPLDSDVLQCT